MEDTILTKFAGMIGTDACPTEQEVAFLEAAYPYFLLPAAMRLANAKDMSEEERRHLERRVALHPIPRTRCFVLLILTAGCCRSFIRSGTPLPNRRQTLQ